MAYTFYVKGLECKVFSQKKLITKYVFHWNRSDNSRHLLPNCITNCNVRWLIGCKDSQFGTYNRFTVNTLRYMHNPEVQNSVW